MNFEALQQQAINIEQLKTMKAQTEGLAILQASSGGNVGDQQNLMGQLSHLQFSSIVDNQIINELRVALASANELVLDWQASMEAWRDLAKTLREEIKACPNHEAHMFGKDGTAIYYKQNNKEDSVRVAKGLPTKYTPAEKGI